MADLFERDKFTYGELYDAVLAVRSPEEALTLFAAYAVWIGTYSTDTDRGGKTPEQVAQHNIGYLFGYGGASNDQIAMWGLVTGSVHPLGFV